MREITEYDFCCSLPGQRVHKAKAAPACGELEAITLTRKIILTFFSRIYGRANFQKNFKLTLVMEMIPESLPEEVGLPFPPALYTRLLIFKEFY